MIRETPIVSAPLVTVARYEHPAGIPHDDPPLETAAGHAISFVESGGFSVQVGRRRWELDRSSLFVTWPGMAYRCRHEERAPRDVCLSFAFAGEAAEERERCGGGASPAAPMTNRLAFLHRRAAALGAGEAMEAEALAAELIAVLSEPGGAGGRLYPSPRLAWYADRVEEALRIMASSFEQPHTLSSLARRAGMSAFHFARVFRELAGIPPHRHLRRLRLEAAAGLLREGRPVSEVCLETGFGSLSHFIRSFRRAYGVSPSRLPGRPPVRAAGK
ncbi:MAG TPA: helix-turn-helix transcriptional regulator [Candidatus Polarisedimenticolia bacterium]|nr:helix-turn-helix transcriptional regulator [Candidatus Polarisedimenticolia bacterium]